MTPKRFYQTILEMQGEGFETRARKDIRRIRMIAAIAIAVASLAYAILPELAGAMIAAFFLVAVGACAGIDGGIRKRIEVWPLFNEVIDWQLVEQKAAE